MKPRSREDLWIAAFFACVVAWILVEIVPAFFDGRVASAIGGR